MDPKRTIATNKDIPLEKKMSIVAQCHKKKQYNLEMTDRIMKVIEPLIVTSKRGNNGTNFASYCPPAISVYEYVYRIVNFATCSKEAFFMALVYIKRLAERNCQGFVSNWTIHRLLITAVLVATKFHDDEYLNNKFYSTVGGIPLREICRCEIEFLARLTFDLIVDPSEIE